ncbi:MAG: DUF433 domain-containing protein [Thermomicrobiales bacterium]
MTVLLAFTLEQASRVTRIPERRIRYWDTTGILGPSLANKEDRGAYSRIYSFHDLVGLRTIGELRDRFGVSLQRLRVVAERLKKHADTPWSELRFYVSGRHLFFRDPETQLLLSALNPGQIALVESLDLVSVARDTEKRAMTLTQRTQDQLGQITRNRYIVNNRPVIAGTRIPTAAIWDFHEAGYSNAEILKEYPRLTPADVQSAIAYEANVRQMGCEIERAS